MASSGRLVYSLVGIIVVLVLAVAGSIGVLVWRYATVTTVLEDLKTCQSDDLPTLYPGYFRNAAQQADFLTRLRRTVKPVQTTNPANCRFNCPRPDFNQTARKRRDANTDDEHSLLMTSLEDSLVREKRAPDPDSIILFGPVYHACCQSWRILTTPIMAETLDGSTVELVQDNNGYSQYFVQEHCEKEETCLNCNCQQPDPFTYSAVYYKDKNADHPSQKYGLTWIQLPGCCKCLNIPSTVR